MVQLFSKPNLPSYGKSRMLQWAFFSIALYAIALAGGKGWITNEGWPLLVQAALTKGANINAGAFIGYWVDRTLYIGYDMGVKDDPASACDSAKAARLMGRACIVAACIIGVSLGTTA